MFEKSPTYASRVHETTIRSVDFARFNTAMLLDTFPNVRSVIVEPVFSKIFPSEKYFHEPINIAQSISTLEYFYDIMNCKLMSQLLYSTLGGRLKKLYLDHCGISQIPTTIYDLKNLPALRKLSLDVPELTLETIEKLHKNILSIQELTLYVVRMESIVLPSDSTPTSSILKLDLFSRTFQNIDAHIQFYKYGTQKYISATDIKYRDNALLRYDDCNDQKQLDLDGILDFIKLVGRNQNNVPLSSVPYDIKPFDEVDAQMESVHVDECNDRKLFLYLSLSNQSKHIKSLGRLDSGINSIHHVKSMPALTTLDIT